MARAALHKVAFSSQKEALVVRKEKPVVVGESHDVPSTAFPVASGVVPWKAHNHMVGHPLIALDH